VAPAGGRAGAGDDGRDRGDAPPQAADEPSQPGADAIDVTTALDCRYRGQSHELTVADVHAFHEEHRRRNGYGRPDDPFEVVALRATATRPPVVDGRSLPAPDRMADGEEVVGPAVIAEPDCTVWVPEGWVARPGRAGALLLERREGA
jgi:N-methylhydantoinase A/oxoprolinase/acetone carboxylase beta subunit